MIINPYMVAPATPSFLNTYSLEFDGVDDYVEFAPASSGPIYDIGTGDFTASIWATSDASGSYAWMMHNWSTNGLGIGRGNGNHFIAYIGDTTLHDTTIEIPWDGTWHHYVVTRNSGACDMYIDGSSVITQFTETGTLATSTASRLGSRGNAVSQLWPGKLDEVSIWNVALSASDVNTLYNSGTPTDLSTALASTPTAWYRMGDTTNAFWNGTNWLIPNNINSSLFSQRSLAFDGVDDTVNLNCVPSDLGITNNWTMSLWIKTSDITQNNMHYFSGANAGTSQGMGIYQETNNRIYAWVGTSTWNQYTAKIDADTWYHVAYTDDGTTQTLYLNGVSQSTQTRTVDLQTNDKGFYVGSAAGSAYFIEGNVDDVAIFDAALSGSDITAIYNSGVPKDESSTANLVGYWRMGEGATFSTNWTIPDDSSDSNDGTSVNMTETDMELNTPTNVNSGTTTNMVEADRVADVP